MSADIREPGAGPPSPDDRAPARSRRSASGAEAESRELDKAPAKIARMFDEIAGRYDLLNTILSGGLDRYWRRRAISSLQLTGTETLLDVCAGTADVAIRGARQGAGAARVIGVDFSGAMLVHGNRKVRAEGLAGRVHLVRGDAMYLPVPDGSVHAVTIAFGIRNVQRADVACRELFRALKPGGRLAILEFGVPRWALFRVVYEWYFHHIVPRIGSTVSGHAAAYTYLPESVDAFQFGEEFAAILRATGFSQVEARPMMFGAVYLYTGQRT